MERPWLDPYPQRLLDGVAPSDDEPEAAVVFGYSSGATLALKAAAQGLAISKLALYDAPFAVDDSHPGLPPDFVQQLAAGGVPLRVTGS